mmetsp:Transcript_6751/g.14916  ORF Transcript_6751/g.14916 Transcript_6751/m.14916 type:complete len:90 (-) Transcript_6751:465-734(-)
MILSGPAPRFCRDLHHDSVGQVVNLAAAVALSTAVTASADAACMYYPTSNGQGAHCTASQLDDLSADAWTCLQLRSCMHIRAEQHVSHA